MNDREDSFRLGDADRDGVVERPTPTQEPESAQELVRGLMHRGHLSSLRDRDPEGRIIRRALARQMMDGLGSLVIPSLHDDIEVKPTVDGSEYLKEHFGGFGPDSPEYDKERRLEIVVPNAKAAVDWFKGAVVPEGHILARQGFEERIPAARHPGVRKVGVEFIKTSDGAELIKGTVEGHFDALSPEEIPKTTPDGLRIDTYAPAKKLFASHMVARLEVQFPGKVELAKDGRSAAVEVEDGVSLCVDCEHLPYLYVTINGSGWITHERYGAKPSPKQLGRELLALQQHFPGIVEAYADFFRKQLPKTVITVDYRNAGSDEAAAGQDPVNSRRMAQLRQELIVTPREDDFKYIGGLDADIAKLREAAMGFAHPEAFREFGVMPPRGILLSGPPGTGKTSLAMAFAREAEATVLSVKSSTIKSAFHGETERNVRGVFQLADELIEDGERVVIFIDEIEALAPARDGFGASAIDRNVTTELLQGMNVDRPNCIIMAATNTPGAIDPALTNNSSRFSQQLEIGFPDAAGRTDILQKLFLKFTDRSSGGNQAALFDPGIQIDTLAHTSEGLTGADLENAIRKVLFTKAVLLASTGERPGPATSGEIYQSIKDVQMGKERTGKSYLR